MNGSADNKDNNSTIASFNVNSSYPNSHQKNQGGDKVPAFKLSGKDLELESKFNINRVYIDEFKDVGDGRLYKGQWNKKTGERDGVGI